MDLSPENRIAGVLTPLFALRSESDLGIGDLAHELERLREDYRRINRELDLLLHRDLGLAGFGRASTTGGQLRVHRRVPAQSERRSTARRHGLSSEPIV